MSTRDPLFRDVGGRGSLVVLSAPSGTGKSTVVRHLLEQVDGLVFSVSATTRPPRDGERDGVEYHFLDRPTFERRLAAGDFIEHAEVHGNLYGTLRSETESRLAAGRTVLLDIDVQGARQVQQSGFECCSVFLLPPSREELERRLRARDTDAAEAIERRLEAARAELAAAPEFDHVILNDEIEDAVARVRLVLRCLRSSGPAMAPVVARVRASFEAASSGGSTP